MNQSSFWDSDRMTMSGAIELTAQSLCTYADRYDHWAIAYSGGKDSSALVSVVLHLIGKGLVPRPKSLVVLRSDTRMELTPLEVAAEGVMAEVRRRGFDARTVLPAMDDRMMVYMLGRGVPPPSNTFRWCTGQIKVEPMLAAVKALQTSGERWLMLTGVRLGRSEEHTSELQ